MVCPQSGGQIVKVGGYVAMLVEGGGGFHRHSNKTNSQKITSGSTLGNHDSHEVISESDAPEISAAVCHIETTKGLFLLALELNVSPVHGRHSAVEIDVTSLLFVSGDVLWKSRLHALMIFGTLGGLTSNEWKGCM